MTKKRREESSFTNAGYQGYKVRIKLVREGLRDYEPVVLEDPKQVYGFMKALEDFDRETFYSIHMDTRNKVVCCEEVAKGTSSLCIIRPADVYKSALLSSAESLIVVHNHPSGDPTPSHEDMLVTDRLVDCGHMLGIRLLDSVILGNGSYYSFMDHGQLKPPYRR